ncbi:hypothetical protein ACU4GD_45240 [Cupriavidus basilensis]
MLLGDSMGEMALYFAAADIAFIGGEACAPLGGQNLIEALLQRRYAGADRAAIPSTPAQATEDATAAGACERVADAGELDARRPQ